jgi:hypothetical protein
MEVLALHETLTKEKSYPAVQLSTENYCSATLLYWSREFSYHSTLEKKKRRMAARLALMLRQARQGTAQALRPTGTLYQCFAAAYNPRWPQKKHQMGDEKRVIGTLSRVRFEWSKSELRLIIYLEPGAPL